MEQAPATQTCFIARLGYIRYIHRRYLRRWMQKKVGRMMTFLAGRPIRTLNNALEKSDGNFDDTADTVFGKEETDNNVEVVDPTSSDIENNAARPCAQSRPAATQHVKAPIRTIADEHRAFQVQVITE